MYKAGKEQVSVFGLRTQFGGGKTTGFALVYDSPEAMKKFEPHYRLVRVGLATKIEKASRQQRESSRMTPRPSAYVFDGRIEVETRADNTVQLQASSARTARRPSAERRRSRAPSPRRTNRWLAFSFWVRPFTGLYLERFLPAGGTGCGSVHYFTTMRLWIRQKARYD